MKRKDFLAGGNLYKLYFVNQVKQIIKQINSNFQL